MNASKVTTQAEDRQTPTPTLAQIIDGSGKSLAQIARESEMSLSHISRIRSSDRLPSVRASAKLAVVLDVPLGELIRAAAEVNRPTRRRSLPEVARRIVKELQAA